MFCVFYVAWSKFKVNYNQNHGHWEFSFRISKKFQKNSCLVKYSFLQTPTQSALAPSTFRLTGSKYNNMVGLQNCACYSTKFQSSNLFQCQRQLSIHEPSRIDIVQQPAEFKYCKMCIFLEHQIFAI